MPDVFSHGRKFRLHLSTDGTTYTEVTQYLEEASESDNIETADVTTASDDGMEYISGQADGSLTASGVWHPTFDRLLDGILDSDEGEVWYRYDPAGQATGRARLEGKGILTASEGTSSVGDKVGTSLTIERTDHDVSRSVQA